MHEDIVEHVSYERGKNEKKPRGHASGYDIGVEDGQKRAWDLVEQAAKWYREKIKEREQEVGVMDDQNYQTRLETCLYIQQVIKRGSL